MCVLREGGGDRGSWTTTIPGKSNKKLDPPGNLWFNPLPVKYVTEDLKKPVRTLKFSVRWTWTPPPTKIPGSASLNEMALCIIWSGVMERSYGVESNFGVEYLGYLMHILALNMLNIWSRCFKSMPWPDVSSKKTSPDNRKCQINWICRCNKDFCRSKFLLHSTTTFHNSAPRLHSIEYMVPNESLYICIKLKQSLINSIGIGSRKRFSSPN